MPILEPAELRQIRDAMITGNLTLIDRPELLYLVNPMVAAALPIYMVVLSQFNSDLINLNNYTNMPDGSIPLRNYLENVADKLYGKQEASVIQGMLEKVSTFTLTSSRPVNLVPKDAGNERAIFRDDMLDYDFLLTGSRVGAAVAKILVSGFEGGNPLITENGTQLVGSGTCWLATKDLIITNHHVINNRLRDNDFADDDDLLLQAKSATVQFDYDRQNANVTTVSVSELICSERNLDYALLRLANTLDRKPLSIHSRIMSPPPGDYVPVNIIQHPNGNPKRVAIRNNLVNSASDETLSYFTDTLSGSSGSPVFNDAWKVVALHRGWQPVVNINFQGKNTAYANYGTQILKIMAHIKQMDLAVWGEIRQAQAPNLDNIYFETFTLA